MGSVNPQSFQTYNTYQPATTTQTPAQGGFDPQAFQNLLAGLQQQQQSQPQTADQFATSQAAPNLSTAYGSPAPSAEAYANPATTYNPATTSNSFAYGSGVSGTAADTNAYGGATTASPYPNTFSYGQPSGSPAGAENNPFAGLPAGNTANNFSSNPGFQFQGASTAASYSAQQPTA